MRVAIVNDLRLACEALRRVVLSVPGNEVAWIATDGKQAIQMARSDRPDVILMDLIMPGVDGAQATREIMSVAPCPIVVVTSSVSGNIAKVYEAMGHGALDAVDTPALGSGMEVTGAAPLLRKLDTVERLVGRQTGSGLARKPAEPPRPAAAASGPPVIAIGSSTGGPSALAELLKGLPKPLPACVVIAQHVDSSFARGLATWLADQSGHRVLPIEGPTPLETGLVLLARTDDHLLFGTDRRLKYSSEPRELFYRPSADVLFDSFADRLGYRGIAVLLTGMGRDGARGLARLRQLGWHTIAQDEASSTVWGMPRAAVELNAACEVLPPRQIAASISSRLHARTRL